MTFLTVRDRSSQLRWGVAKPPLLVIEREPQTRDYLDEVLSGAGYPVHIAPDAESAADLLRRPEFRSVQHIILGVDEAAVGVVQDLFTLLQAPDHRRIILLAPKRLRAALGQALELHEQSIIPKPCRKRTVLQIVAEHVNGRAGGVPQ